MRRGGTFVLMAGLALAASNNAGAQGLALCAGNHVNTGTPFGRVPIQMVSGFEITPELIQGAALHASVAQSSQTAVERALIERMSSQGKWGRVEDRIWPQVRDGMMAAKPQVDAVAQQKREMAGRVIAGTIAGVGSVAMNGNIDSGIYAAQNYGARGAQLMQSPGMAAPSAGATVVTGPALEGAIDQMVAAPCQVSAGQVLQRLRAQ